MRAICRILSYVGWESSVLTVQDLLGPIFIRLQQLLIDNPRLTVRKVNFVVVTLLRRVMVTMSSCPNSVYCLVYFFLLIILTLVLLLDTVVHWPTSRTTASPFHFNAENLSYFRLSHGKFCLWWFNHRCTLFCTEIADDTRYVVAYLKMPLQTSPEHSRPFCNRFYLSYLVVTLKINIHKYFQRIPLLSESSRFYVVRYLCNSSGLTTQRRRQKVARRVLFSLDNVYLFSPPKQ